jgi:glyoxylase-like metal-dependent hydrolase (beta-lactamase superfamily II)
MSEYKNPISIFDDLKMIRPPSSYWPESANVYVFKDDDGISLFDVGCGSMASVERLFSVLKVLGWESKPVKKIILSHAHPDHMGAMEMLLSEVLPECIFLHENDLPYALDPERLMHSFDIALCKKHFNALYGGDQKTSKGPEFDLIPYFQALDCSMCRAEPDKTVAEGDVIRVGEHHFEVFHTPGHAPGHISLYDRNKRILVAGDIVGEMVAWYTPSSGGASGYLESLEKIEGLDIDLILPSHGDMITDSRKGIQEIKDKILEKDRIIMEALQTGEKTFDELISLLFKTPQTQFFPGTPILISHLQKLKSAKKVKEERHSSKTFYAIESR